MKKHSVDAVVSTIGVDLGDKFSRFCVLDLDGKVIDQGSIPTTREGFEQKFGMLKPTRVVLETGTHANWVHDVLVKLKHRVVIANARKLRAISANERKSDERDARMLARLGRVDVELLQPVTVREEQIRLDLTQLRARDELVEARTKLVNSARGLAKSMGERLPVSSAKTLHKRPLPPKVSEALMPVFESIKALSASIEACEKRLEEVAQTRYPQTKLVRQVGGVGLITSLYFVLSIGDVRRFKNGRAVGAYYGLVPRRDQSGERDPQLSITKCGDPLGRKLLVQCAHSIIARGPDSDLKRFGKKLAEKRGTKRAIVATARRLAGLLFSLLRSGVEYEPLRNSPKSEEVKTIVLDAGPPISRPSRTRQSRSARRAGDLIKAG